MYSLMWMPDPDRFKDEIVTLAQSELPERLMAKDCVRGLLWDCDGDGWSSVEVIRDHGVPGEEGRYYVSQF